MAPKPLIGTAAMKPCLATLLLSSALLSTPALATEPASVVSHYADMAQAEYADSLTAAQSLRAATDATDIGDKPRHRLNGFGRRSCQTSSGKNTWD